jgi:hypothetical protein
MLKMIIMIIFSKTKEIIFCCKNLLKIRYFQLKWTAEKQKRGECRRPKCLPYKCNIDVSLFFYIKYFSV